MPTPFLTSKASLAMRGDVRAILGVTGRQAALIQAEIDNLGSVPISGTAGGALAIFEKLDASIRPIFSEAQWNRLVQLWVQFEGPYAVQSEEIRTQLKLSPEVFVKIDELIKTYAGWWAKEMPKVRKSSDLGKFRNEARKIGRKILELLNSEQRKAFEEMQGPKFKFRN